MLGLMLQLELGRCSSELGNILKAFASALAVGVAGGFFFREKGWFLVPLCL